MPDTRRDFLKRAVSGLAVSTAGRTSDQGPARGRALDTLRSPQPGEAVLACAGDWFLTRRLSGAVDLETDVVFDVFRRAAGGFANLENGLSTIGTGDLGGFRYGAPLRGHPDLASELAWGGVRAVSLANNHTGNYGRDALLETIATLDGARVQHAGAGANLADAFAPALVRAGELTVAFISVYTLYHSFGADDQATLTKPGVAVCRAYDVVVQPQVGFDSTNFNSAPYILDLREGSPHTIVAALREDVDRLKMAIAQASSRADFTLMSAHVHWGRHTKHDLPPNLRAFAREMVDAGVDLFLGHGPHAIRGIEIYHGKPIVHSVGNFVLMPSSAPTSPSSTMSPGREGLVVRATIGRRSVRSLEILPLAIEASGNPRFADGAEAAHTLGKLAGLSAPLGVDIAAQGWYGNVSMT